MSLRPFLALVRKDLKLTAHDRRAVILSFVAPIALGSFMAAMMGGAGEQGGGRIAIRVVDEDGSSLSKSILGALEGEKTIDAVAASAEEAREDVRKGDAVLAVVFPPGFGAAAGRAIFGAAEKPTLRVLHDPSHAAEVGMVRGILIQHVMQVVSRDAFGGSGGLASVKEALAQVESSEEIAADDKQALREMFAGILKWQEHAEAVRTAAPRRGPEPLMGGGISVPFETKEETVTAGGQVAKTAMHAHAFVGMAVQFILFGAIEAGVGLLTEREKGLWKRLRAAPLSRLLLLAAKAASGSVWSLLIALVVMFTGMLIFGFRIEGSVPGFLLVAAAYALTAATFGLLIAALGKTPQAARGVSILAVLMMVMLGGAWVPTFLFPQWLQGVTPVIPTRWAVDGFDGTLWRGYTLVESLKPVAALLGFSALFGTLAAFRFRWEAE